MGYRTYIIQTSTFYPPLEEEEVNLVAMIAATLIEPDNKTIRLPDMTIQVPKGNLPTYDMIRKLISIFKGGKGNVGITGTI